MKKLGALALALSLAMTASAQGDAEGKPSLASRLAEKGILNHMDVGVNVGTLGFGIDVAVPVGDYVRVRAGYNYLPSFKFKSDFNIETRNGSIGSLMSKVGKIDDKFQEFGDDINEEKYADYKEKLDKFRNVEVRDYVTMNLTPDAHQFKLLVDVLPFRNNKHWSLTAGFFVGPSSVADAYNMDKETIILEGINAYNDIYKDYPEHGIAGTYLHKDGRSMDDPFYKYGLAGFNLGKFDDGDMAMMVPGPDNSVRAKMEVSKFRPYLGFGYNTSLSKDKKWNLNVDAGLLFLCGAPSVYVDNVYKIDAGSLVLDADGNYVSGIGFDADGNYYGDIFRWNPDEWGWEEAGSLLNHVDMVHDLHDVRGKAGNMVRTISRFKVYPNVSVTFTYRLF